MICLACSEVNRVDPLSGFSISSKAKNKISRRLPTILIEAGFIFETPPNFLVSLMEITTTFL